MTAAALFFPWNECPSDVVLSILDMLDDYRDLASCSLVSKSWNEWARDSSLYRTIDSFIFPLRFPSHGVTASISHCDQLASQVSLTRDIFQALWTRSGKCLTRLSLEYGAEDVLINCIPPSPHAKPSLSVFWNKPSLSFVKIEDARQLDLMNLTSLVAGAPSLTVLKLKGCLSLNDAVATAIGSLCQLQVLQLEEAYELTDTGLFAMLEGIGQNLTDFTLNRCPNITFLTGEEKPPQISLPNLVRLSIRNCRSLDDNFLPAFLALTQGSRIRELDFTNLCSCFTDQALTLVQNAFSRLTVLNLSGCYCMGDIGFASLLNVASSFMPALVQSDNSLAAIFGTTCNLYDRTMDLILPHAEETKWRYLDISGCSQLTDRVLPLLALLAPHLVELRVAECSGLSHAALNRLLQDRPDLSILRW